MSDCHRLKYDNIPYHTIPYHPIRIITYIIIDTSSSLMRAHVFQPAQERVKKKMHGIGWWGEVFSVGCAVGGGSGMMITLRLCRIP